MISDLSRQLLNDIGDTLSGLAQSATQQGAQQDSQQGQSERSEGSAAQAHIKQALQSALRKLDLVTRDEFDAQTAVLLRTRERLEAMEKTIAELEEKTQA